MSTINLNNSKVKIISLGLLPLIPAPPIIPTFFFPSMGYKEFCSGENYKIKLVFENKFNTLNNIENDLNGIYLLKDNEKIICANDYINELKTYENAVTKKIDSYKNLYTKFSITCKETNNSV